VRWQLYGMLVRGSMLRNSRKTQYKTHAQTAFICFLLCLFCVIFRSKSKWGRNPGISGIPFFWSLLGFVSDRHKVIIRLCVGSYTACFFGGTSSWEPFLALCWLSASLLLRSCSQNAKIQISSDSNVWRCHGLTGSPVKSQTEG